MAKKKRPTLYVIAGPNGAGKSTLYETRIKPTVKAPFINADIIQKNELKDTDPQASYEAAQIAAQRRQEHIKSGKSFVAESVFSHESKLDLVKDAKQAGFRVVLYHVNVRDENVSVSRVAARVNAGGHPVPDEKIRARYHRNQDIIKQAAKLADYAFIYDNSREGVKPAAAFTLKNGKLKEIHKEVPKWARELYAEELKTASPGRLNPGAASFEEAKKITRELGGEDATLSVTKRNRMYAGKVVGETSLHLIQKTIESKYIAHFKSNLKGDEAKLGSVNALVYDHRGKAQSYDLRNDTARSALLSYSSNVRTLASYTVYDELNAKQLAAVALARGNFTEKDRDVVARFDRAMTDPKKADKLDIPEPIKKALVSEALEEQKNNSRDAKMAVALVSMKRTDALHEYPELAGAYAKLDVVNKKLDAENLNEKQRAQVVSRITQKLAKEIRGGHVQQMKIQERKTGKDVKADPLRDSDLER